MLTPSGCLFTKFASTLEAVAIDRPPLVGGCEQRQFYHVGGMPTKPGPDPQEE
jgi:hypothetical protein